MKFVGKFGLDLYTEQNYLLRQPESNLGKSVGGIIDDPVANNRNLSYEAYMNLNRVFGDFKLDFKADGTIYDQYYKSATAFTDTITSYNWSYKWMVVRAGAVPTANTAPTAIGTGYTLTFAAADIIIDKVAATSTTFADRTTYSMLLYGKKSGTTVSAPYGSFFRNRIM